jgi:3-deoxy-manno-octulosonate cytidylyltransferase (CMP-KDO synthetase)
MSKGLPNGCIFLHFEKMKTAKIAIVIPARFGSTRFPGKPLAKIAGQTMLERVVYLARKAAEDFRDDVALYVTTEDQRIADHADSIGVKCIITSKDAPTGSDRVLEALKKTKQNFEFVLNLQGDAPFIPREAIEKIIREFQRDPHVEVVTPVQQLSWDDFDALREAKKITPFSGTTVIVDKTGHALWFSKNIIPAIRDEKTLRIDEKFSPVYQHIGLYGYHIEALEKFCAISQSYYEKREGLEQLRLLENGIRIKTVPILKSIIHSGIDSPEDLARAEALYAAMQKTPQKTGT